MTDSESQAATDRARAVSEAIRSGKIPVDAAPEWLARLKEDPSKAVYLANAAPGFRPPSGNPVRQALHTGTPPPAPPVERETRTVELGGGLINMQAQLLSGKPHSEWSYEEGRDAALWAMGPRFRQGLKPPPEPVWFIPTDGISHTTDQEFNNHV
jgi:hypothetical protein